MRRFCEVGGCDLHAAYRGKRGWKNGHGEGAWCEDHLPMITDKDWNKTQHPEVEEIPDVVMRTKNEV